MMCVALHVPNAETGERRQVRDRIRRALDRDDLMVVTPNGAESSGSDLTLESVDAFVLEGATADTETGFLLAHAIALKKPTLVLYPRGAVAKVLHHMSLPTVPNWISVVSYADRSLERLIEEFLLAVGGHRLKPSPRIKFTLRITAQIEEFLRFKTINTKTSKADWVRDRLERLMAEDRDWLAAQRTKGRRGTDES